MSPARAPTVASSWERSWCYSSPPQLVRALDLRAGAIFAIPAAELSARAFVLRPFRLLDHAAGEIALTALADMRPDGQVLLPRGHPPHGRPRSRRCRLEKEPAR